MSEPTKRQIYFLTKRYGFDFVKVKNYLDDLCTSMKVSKIANKYKTNTVQVQRDRNRFIKRSVRKSVVNGIKIVLKNRN